MPGQKDLVFTCKNEKKREDRKHEGKKGRRERKGGGKEPMGRARDGYTI